MGLICLPAYNNNNNNNNVTDLTPEKENVLFAHNPRSIF
jgi:hypothetical protein